MDAGIQARTPIAVAGDWVRPMATAGTLLRIDPKMGMIDITLATTARMGQYLSPKSEKPMAERTPLTRQIISCPRTTPESPRSSRRRKRSYASRDDGAHSSRRKAKMRSCESIR